MQHISESESIYVQFHGSLRTCVQIPLESQVYLSVSSTSFNMASNSVVYKHTVNEVHPKFYRQRRKFGDT